MIPTFFSFWVILQGYLFTGVYNIEPFWDFNWAIFSYSLNLLYHFIVLQSIAIVSKRQHILLFIIILERVKINTNYLFSACPSKFKPYAVSSYFRPIWRAMVPYSSCDPSGTTVSVVVQGLLPCCRVLSYEVPIDKGEATDERWLERQTNCWNIEKRLVVFVWL